MLVHTLNAFYRRILFDLVSYISRFSSVFWPRSSIQWCIVVTRQHRACATATSRDSVALNLHGVGTPLVETPASKVTAERERALRLKACCVPPRSTPPEAFVLARNAL
jgi:hypothetical protein